MFAQALYAVPGWGTNKQIEDEIKSGQIAYTLGKPYSYIFFNYASFLGKVVNPFITSLAVGSAATLFFIGPIHITPTSLIASLFQAFLGLTIWFGLSLNLGMLSFWIEDTSAFRWILSKSIMILGGMIIPVSLFPDYLKNITKILPFNYMTAAPAQTFVNYSATESLTIILMQLLWISVFLLSAGLLVQRGGKYVSINGG
jgi:ABC-2 type transport system permease protein